MARFGWRRILDFTKQYQMVSKFTPIYDEVILIERNTMYHILEGKGAIEVDFKKYIDWQDKLIFLEKGQYVKFLSDSFTVRRIEFDDKELFESKEVRVLFKHLVALGYIDFNECSDCQKYLNSIVLSQENSNIIDVSSEQWFWQNPFQASKEEYHIIFDIKEIVDAEYKNNLTNDQITKIIGIHGHQSQALVKDKIGLTVRSLIGQKRYLESQKEIAFSDKSIKEIAYDFGYKDPAYFNRVFNKRAGLSPQKFRELKSLSRKVKDKLNLSLGQLIRQEIINTAKLLLQTPIKVKDIAFQLGFEEANNFSAFFKHHTSSTPAEYRQKLDETSKV